MILGKFLNRNVVFRDFLTFRDGGELGTLEDKFKRLGPFHRIRTDKSSIIGKTVHDTLPFAKQLCRKLIPNHNAPNLIPFGTFVFGHETTTMLQSRGTNN